MTNRRSSVLIVDDLSKTYRSGGQHLAAVSNVTFRVDDGETVAIVGPSGSGKTTLLGLLAGLDQPSGGTISLDGTDLGSLGEDGRAKLRRERIGFVFQSFQLIPTLTARENVEVPLQLRGDRVNGRAEELLARVGLAGRGHHYPAQLSGGEQQRVAIARAFVHGPRILFADEPTGNLDAATGQRVIDLLMALNREEGTTLVLVTHDLDLAGRARRVIRLADGRVVSDERSGS
ncbi:MAG: ABC transporter ATP-binding protein [Gemmatimonadetes bacterium]|nr:ABC transporter ATP-binding protein [Gemmatimonadota bacterium]